METSTPIKGSPFQSTADLALSQTMLLWSIDREPLLIPRLCKTFDLSKRNASALLHEVLKFLCVCHASEEELTPSLTVDLAWHECILFTRYYQELCEKFFGEFIHHNPGGEDSGRFEHQYLKTIKALTLSFNHADKTFWPHGIIIDAGQCGSCEN